MNSNRKCCNIIKMRLTAKRSQAQKHNAGTTCIHLQVKGDIDFFFLFPIVYLRQGRQRFKFSILFSTLSEHNPKYAKPFFDSCWRILKNDFTVQTLILYCVHKGNGQVDANS